MNDKTLINMNPFVSYHGIRLDFKIECDALSDADMQCIAMLIASRFKFGEVEGIPQGGLRLAHALQPFCTIGPTLIVDDVLTTGRSMDKFRQATSDRGVVIFARGPCPEWVTPIFQLNKIFA